MIHRFHVQNYKSLIDVSVDLLPVTVLVGKSGTGKSNFVEAIRFFRDVLSSRPQTRQPKETWAHCRPAMNQDAQMRFELDFSISGVNEMFRYELGVSNHGPDHPPTEEILQLGHVTLFHQKLDIDDRRRQVHTWVVEPKLLEVPTAGHVVLGRIPSISEVVIAFTALTSGVGCYAFPDKVLCEGSRDQPTSGLDDNALNYLAALKEIVSNLQDLSVRKRIVAALQRVNPSVSSVELNDIRQPTHVVVGHQFDGKTLALQLAQESDGFRRFYAHLLALYQRPPKQTLMFEHPEDGIHPGALALLAEEFKATPADNRGQVILTTHSPKLLDHFDAEQIRVVELDGFETRIGLVSSEQRDAIQDDLLDAGELLTVDPARIDSSVAESTGA
jgi:hypothetical protein